jgi:hypothetical protein
MFEIIGLFFIGFSIIKSATLSVFKDNGSNTTGLSSIVFVISIESTDFSIIVDDDDDDDLELLKFANGLLVYAISLK